MHHFHKTIKKKGHDILKVCYTGHTDDDMILQVDIEKSTPYFLF